MQKLSKKRRDLSQKLVVITRTKTSVCIAAMEAICKNAAEQWASMTPENAFRKGLLDCMVAARHGLRRCYDTYVADQKPVTAANILARAITVLDYSIPEEVRVQEGIQLHRQQPQREHVAEEE